MAFGIRDRASNEFKHATNLIKYEVQIFEGDGNYDDLK